MAENDTSSNPDAESDNTSPIPDWALKNNVAPLWALPAPRPGPGPVSGEGEDQVREWNSQQWVEKVKKAGLKFAMKTMIGTYLAKTNDSPAMDNLSFHYWFFEAGLPIPDDRHREDEAYYVIFGCGSLVIEGTDHSYQTGDLLFVPRCASHRFVAEEPTLVLIIFSPNFSTRSPSS